MTLTHAILATLRYSDHFSFPLTLNEIHLRLISSDPYSIERVITALHSMIHNHLIQQTGEYYYLLGRASLVSRRLSRQQLSTLPRQRAQQLAHQLAGIPGVLAIYLTGSLAVYNAGRDADIDLMIIARSHRLWTTRLLLTLYAEFLGLRRRPHDSHASGKLCLNLYLTPTSYCLPPTKRNLYTAYELIQAVPLYDPHDTRAALLSANPWINQYLPNVKLPATRARNSSGKRSLVEKLAYKFQLAYMRPRLTREYITPDSAFFHPHDPGAAVLQKIRL